SGDGSSSCDRAFSLLAHSRRFLQVFLDNSGSHALALHALLPPPCVHSRGDSMSPRTWVVPGLVAAGLVVFAFLWGTHKQDPDRAERYRDKIRQLREQFPFESLEGRLPPPPRYKG